MAKLIVGRKLPEMRHTEGPGPSRIDRTERRPKAKTLRLSAVLAILSLGTAGIHLSVAREHLEAYVLFGLFFFGVAWLEAAWAIAVVRWFDRRLLIAGLVGNAALVTLWVASRTTGLPVGPMPWTPEPAETVDSVCTALEVVIAAGCARSSGVFAPARARTPSPQ